MTPHEKNKRIRAASLKVLTDTGKSKKSVVADFNKYRGIDYPENERFFEDLQKVVADHAGKISTLAALGALELVKSEIINND